MKKFSFNNGFTLIELIIYMGISSILFASIIPLSFFVEKELAKIHQEVEKEETADLIFKTYRLSRNSDSGLLFVCDQNGARIGYSNFSNDPPGQIGYLASSECHLNDGLLAFEVQGKEYQEDYSET